MEVVFGVILVAIVAGVTWCVSAEGAWGSVLTFLAVLFAGLLTMNFFEPTASLLDSFGSWMEDYSDLTAFLGLFALFTFLLRLATDNISPSDVELDGRIQQVVRWLFGLATGYLTMAILLTALHTAPLPRSFLGFKPEGLNFFEISAPDRQWLGFTQHVSEKVLVTGKIFDGPKYAMPPDSNDVRVWSSFPIRYATRRIDYAAGRRTSASGGGLGPAPGVAPAPAGGTPAGF
ncbi:MAG: CvpA family protein [Planctomycetes bacterium]|nr:CvpA family protein [Planctomycetota bacterium]